MKIELKNIQHSESLSKETNAFSANLYIDGKFAGYARNDGRGGNTSIQPKDGMDRMLIEAAEAYCKTLPPHSEDSGESQNTVDMDLEYVVDDLLEEHLRKKDQKKLDRQLAKAMEKGIVYGTKD